MVPLGPKLDLSTSCRPMAAVMFICSAWPRLATSALGFASFRAADADLSGRERVCSNNYALRQHTAMGWSFH
ncbi:hypothetical protein BC938DRAFT_483496 [Jimgerdemannia flammicorona]|uniref:Uncharacterized protein n=1 Tax=Jimgerdemannia flammicorona TaxID=994334 RepID=A0A433QBU6_9FUNG|nr:hypothetical protein BC938DRAFT_483496 [Jimgerdemannia flammicorona]